MAESLPTPVVNPIAEAQPPNGAAASTPDGAEVRAPENEERRRHPRAPVDLQVGLKFESVQQFLAVYAEDISESGMFLRSDHAGALREVGQEVELRFDAGNRRIVQGRGRVVRVMERGAVGGGAGIGVEFVELDETSRKLVEAIVRIKLAAVHGA